MGIHGLWPLLEPTGRPIALESLEGKRLAVDISLWLCQAAQGYSAHGISSKSPHLSLLLHRIGKLIYYKIRPIFVFDGEKVPELKKQVLRERALRKHLSEMTLNKKQKDLLEQLAKQQLNAANGEASTSREVADEIAAHFIQQHREDVFELPETPDNEFSSKKDSPKDPTDYLSGYHKLLSEDERIRFLLDAKERAKTDRLNPEDIPTDSLDFSHFQLKRLVKRNAINTELDKLKAEKDEMLNPSNSSDQMETVIVDSELRGHILRRNTHNPLEERSQKAQPFSKPAPPCSWDEFLAKIKSDYGSEESDCGTGGFNYEKVVRRLAVREDGDDEDPDLQKAITESLRHRIVAANTANIPEPMDVDEANDRAIAEALNDSWTSEESDITDSDSDGEDGSSDSDFIDVSDGEMPTSSRPIVDSDSKELIPPTVRSLSTPPRNPIPKTTANIETASKSVLPNPSGDDEWMAEGVKESGETTRAPKSLIADPLTEMEIGEGVYAECQRLLRLLGLPYIVAPGEAEAQCVCLERLGLCDGVVTDDSDAWPFGVGVVYKNMFSRKENVHEFRRDRVDAELGLGQMEFVAIGMLSGGDYSKGFDGVGVVTALELIAEVSCSNAEAADVYAEGFKRLERIAEWLKSKRRFVAENPNGTFRESKAKCRLRRLIEKRNDQERLDAFPSDDVYKAYLRPDVDQNPKRFQWSPVEFESLYDFVWTTVGWSPDELNQRTHGALKIWNEFMESAVQHYQLRMTAFLQKPMKYLECEKLAPTSRVLKVLKTLKKRKGKKGYESDSEAEASSDAPGRLKSLVERAKRSTRRRIDDDFYDDSILKDFVIPERSTVQQPSSSSTSTSESQNSTKSKPKRKAPTRATTRTAAKSRRLVVVAPQPRKFVEVGPNLSEDSEEEAVQMN